MFHAHQKISQAQQNGASLTAKKIPKIDTVHVYYASQVVSFAGLGAISAEYGRSNQCLLFLSSGYMIHISTVCAPSKLIVTLILCYPCLDPNLITALLVQTPNTNIRCQLLPLLVTTKACHFMISRKLNLDKETENTYTIFMNVTKSLMLDDSVVQGG